MFRETCHYTRTIRDLLLIVNYLFITKEYYQYNKYIYKLYIVTMLLYYLVYLIDFVKVRGNDNNNNEFNILIVFSLIQFVCN